MNTDERKQPLTPAISPYPAFVGLRRGKKGERENLSLVFESSIGLDFRMLPGPGRNNY
jgi:hypothetical protein